VYRIAVLLLLTAACARQPLSRPIVSDEAFHIGVLGDMPYIASEDQRAEKTAAYERVLASINRADLERVVHIGDFAAGGQCSDSLYLKRVEEFKTIRHPLVYLFGDNEWTDCRAGGFDPLERLGRLRQLFAAPGTGTLGGRSVSIVRQSGSTQHSAYSENVRWVRGNVVFVGIHMVGSNNNWGPDSLPSAEHRARAQANIQWLREAFAEARRIGAVGVAVFTQANPLPSAAARAQRPNGFADVVAELRVLALDFDRPVALIHGDTHYFRVDMPFEEATTRRVYARITRAETFGDPNSHWIRVTVDPRDPNVFSFRPMLIPENIRGGR
jgi:hypothetical protein